MEDTLRQACAAIEELDAERVEIEGFDEFFEENEPFCIFDMDSITINPWQPSPDMESSSGSSDTEDEVDSDDASVTSTTTCPLPLRRSKRLKNQQAQEQTSSSLTGME